MPSQASHNTSRVSNLFSFIFSIFLIGVALWVVFNRQLIVDHLTVWQHQPTAEVKRLAERSKMSDEGKFLFYASTPQVSERQEFIDQCGANSEQAAILGCYTAQRIFIFDVQDQRLDGIREVTAAHEMLHAAYDRLSESERTQVDRLVEDAYKQIDNDRLDSLIEYYDKTEPGQRHNELYAILGTEHANLPDDLEAHYRKYFDDREKVVVLANNYQQTFKELSNKQQDIIEDLDRLSTEIESSTASYNMAVASLAEDISNFNQRANSGEFASQAEFNYERAILIDRQTNLQSEQQRIETLIARYEKQRIELEKINLVVEDLNHSINANLSETPKL